MSNLQILEGNSTTLKNSLLLLIILFSTFSNAQEKANESFKSELEKHCEKSYEGIITEGAKEGDGFTGERLVMQVLSCEENQIKIPFYVGEDKSRTWILTFQGERVQLKHDHRHEDGSDDEVTMYGGTSTNTGFGNMQISRPIRKPVP